MLSSMYPCNIQMVVFIRQLDILADSHRLHLRPLGTSCLKLTMLTLDQRGLQTFTINGDIINILVFVSYTASCSYSTLPLQCKSSNDPIKLYKNRWQTNLAHVLQFTDLCLRYLENVTFLEVEKACTNWSPTIWDKNNLRKFSNFSLIKTFFKPEPGSA